MAFTLVVLWKRYVSLASIVTAMLFPLLAGLGARLGWREYGGPWLVLSSAAIALLIVSKHQKNLRRLWRGSEPRLGERRRAATGEGRG